jgi:hypothetical protein
VIGARGAERVEALPDRLMVYTPDGEGALAAVTSATPMST